MSRSDPPPRISVCIPTFNGARHLKECLDSVLAQTLHDFELLIVEDGSRDETPDIVAEYARRDSRIRVISNGGNLGLVQNWNRCVELSRGHFIKFAFQDDVLFPDCLLRLVELAEKTGKPMVFCSREIWFDPVIAQEVRGEYDRLPTLKSLFGGHSEVCADDVIAMVMAHPINFFGEPTTALLDRALFTRFGCFNTTLVHHSDFEYWVRVGIHTGIAFTSENLAAFRLHPSSTSSLNRTRAFRAEYLDELILLHEYAYNACYGPLRRAFERASHNPKKVLAAKAEWLRAMAMRAAASGDGGPLAEWRKIASAYPRVRWSRHHLPIRARAWRNRHISWRLRDRARSPGS